MLTAFDVGRTCASGVVLTSAAGLFRRESQNQCLGFQCTIITIVLNTGLEDLSRPRQQQIRAYEFVIKSVNEPT